MKEALHILAVAMGGTLNRDGGVELNDCWVTTVRRCEQRGQCHQHNKNGVPVFFVTERWLFGQLFGLHLKAVWTRASQHLLSVMSQHFHIAKEFSRNIYNMKTTLENWNYMFVLILD